MSSSGGVFSATLQSITTTKLTELSKKRAVFEAQKAALLAAADSEHDQKTKLRILVDGVKKTFSLKTSTRKRGDRHGTSRQIISGSTKDPQLERLLRNLERFLAQAQYDPSVSPKLLQNWEEALKHQLEVQSSRYQYATLYGELVTEWLSSERPSTPPDGDDAEMTEDFEYVHRETQAKDEGRAQWERLVFEPFETDPVTISSYLKDLFGQNGTSKQVMKALHALRKSVAEFESTLSVPGQFNEEVLRWTINGLLASGLLNVEKSAALRDFLISPVILVEVADVLNMRMASIDTWTWGLNGLPVEQRRHVTGRYHIYIEEDILQAIFLQFIGVKWSVFLKGALIDFSQFEGAWKSLRAPISKVDNERRDFFLGHQMKKPSVQSKRQALYNSIYFLSQLPDSVDQDKGGVEGEEEVDFDSRPTKRPNNGDNHTLQDYQPQKFAMAQQQAQAQMQRQQQLQAHQQLNMLQLQQANKKRLLMAQQMPATTNDGGIMRAGTDEYDLENHDKKPKSQMETKQFLLHLLSTEILVNTRLRGEFTCIHSEFDAWNPSLPHSTVYSVLSFFGLSDKWLRFFRNFLESPLKMKHGSGSSEPRIRRRGAPGAHALSVVCGEAVLFCLDYAINQRTNGAQLYRLHDDFWFWSSSHETVVTAWETITGFTKIMGVSLNEAKTGSVRIMGKKTEPGILHPSLPDGDIRWGFLYLDPSSGHFVIDQKMVDKHIEELKRQLQDKNSVFAWIQAWNTYAGRFFTSNFGKPANCFGREHVDSMLESLERIQRRIFSDTSVVEYLKNTMRERFDISDIPDGYLYFPTALGGLELHNPFIGLVQLRDSVFEQPEAAIDDFLDAEAEAYRKAKWNFENGQVYRYANNSRLTGTKDFMSFDEFTRYREEFCSSYDGNLSTVFEELLQQPTAESVDVNHTDQLMLSSHSCFTSGYWKWVASLYGPDIAEKFGGLNIVDSGVLPIGMVNLFREGKVKWQG